MKFVPETLEGVNIVSRFDAGGAGGAPMRLWVGGAMQQHSVLVPWAGDVQRWPVATFADLTLADFERMAAFAPELVVFGSGRRMRFAPPALLRPLVERRIGIECMDTAAACRTYNVLVSEKRSVLAALLLDGP
ncbi:MAG: Mth938-like domain-containing protein [Rubrivivax sp.]|nr:Mth938-like domain-containing protein [Rubrivivax sp.]